MSDRLSGFKPTTYYTPLSSRFITFLALVAFVVTYPFGIPQRGWRWLVRTGKPVGEKHRGNTE